MGREREDVLRVTSSSSSCCRGSGKECEASFEEEVEKSNDSSSSSPTKEEADEMRVDAGDRFVYTEKRVIKESQSVSERVSGLTSQRETTVSECATRLPCESRESVCDCSPRRRRRLEGKGGPGERTKIGVCLLCV